MAWSAGRRVSRSADAATNPAIACRRRPAAPAGRAPPAPPTGQDHEPSMSTRRTPGDSSQRRIFSVSSGVRRGCGPRGGHDHLGGGAQARRRASGRRRGATRVLAGQPAVPDARRPPSRRRCRRAATICGQRGQRRDPLGPGGRADEVRAAGRGRAGSSNRSCSVSAGHPRAQRRRPPRGSPRSGRHGVAGRPRRTPAALWRSGAGGAAAAHLGRARTPPPGAGDSRGCTGAAGRPRGPRRRPPRRSARSERAEVAGAVAADLPHDRQPGERLDGQLDPVARSGNRERRL